MALLKNLKKAKGFTLIELLVVVAIIGILAAIAIPQFAEYRKRAFDSRAESDLRNAATGEEAYYVDNETYVGDSCDGDGTGFSDIEAECSARVEVTMTGGATSFTGTAAADGGTQTFSYDSEAGGMQ